MTRARRKTLVLLSVAVALGALAVAWDWNWFRAPLERHVAERSGREVHIGGLQLTFDGLDPTVTLRDLDIANAPWARGTAGQPFAKAAEVSFTFAWRSLLERRPVVSRLRLVDADVALERRADGLRNWRVNSPDDRGAGKFKFLRLEPVRSRLRFVHEGIALDLRTEATALPAAMPVEHGASLTTRVDFDGTFRGNAFKGTATTSPVLSFMETGDPFSLRGAATTGKTRVEADGQVTDLFRLSAVDALLHVSGPSLADLRGLLPGSWPDTPRYDARARLAKADDQWALTELQAELGRSDVAGNLLYNARADRPHLEATLTSRIAHVGDLLPRAAGKPAVRGEKPQDTPSRAPDLRRLDAEVSLDVKTLHVPGLPPVTQFRARARLDDGLLDLSPVQGQLAGGSAQARLSVDGRQAIPTARAELAWRQLRLELLLPPLPDDGEATGPVSGQLKLASHGTTWDTLVAQADGQGSAWLKGGRLSAGLDAKLALNGGKLLRAKVADAPPVPILCARVDVVVRQGQGDVFPLLLDTAQTRVDGRGTVDLREPRFDLVLTPSPKQSALLALHQSIRVSGSPDAPRVDLVKADPIDARAGCDTPPSVNPAK